MRAESIVLVKHVKRRTHIKFFFFCDLKITDNISSEVKERFLEEIKLQIEIGSHPNILSVLGCVTITEPYCMITEFMKYGDLLNFLWKCNKVGRISCINAIPWFYVHL